MSTVIIWCNDSPVMQVLKKECSYQSFLEKAKLVFGVQEPDIYFLHDDMKVQVINENYACLFEIPAPILLLAEENNGSLNEHDGTDDDEANVSPDLDKTVQQIDLSAMNKTLSAGGSRWTDIEEAYLKNFHKFCRVKRIEKPEQDNLNEWLTRRKTTRQHLFGLRTSNAILGRYKLMIQRGEMRCVDRDIQKYFDKRRKRATALS